MSEKKLFCKLSDGYDYSNVVMELSGCMEWINADAEFHAESDDEPKEYVLVPVWMTQEEFDSLPEGDS